MLYIVNLFPFTHEHTTKASTRDSRNRAPFVSVACPNTDLSLSRTRLSARACHLNQKPITYATNAVSSHRHCPLPNVNYRTAQLAESRQEVAYVIGF